MKIGKILTVLLFGLLIFVSLASSQSGSPASVGDDPVMGQEDAPVTIVKFTDLGCPFCKRWHENTLPEIRDEFVEEGQVRVVYKDNPIPQLHPDAPKAHVASNCVYENEGSEEYFEYVDEIFESQGEGLKEDNLLERASDAGYDIESCMSENDYQDEIDEDKQEAQAAGLQGTPHFVVKASDSDTGTPVQGAQPYSAFEQVIESKLSGEGDYEDPEEEVENESDSSEDSGNEEDQELENCNGCMHEGNCLPIGHRIEENGTSKYCSVSGELEIQKSQNDSCKNNYECATNRCSSGECINLQEEVRENQGILKSIQSFFGSLFG